MIDFRRKNPAHGLTGVKFESVDDYIRTIGYLSNPNHHSTAGNNIQIYIENNQQSGAHAAEWRIAFYGDENFLKNNLPALYSARSAGVGRIKYRINSIDFINHLQNIYKFSPRSPRGYVQELTAPSNSISGIINDTKNFITPQYLMSIEEIQTVFRTGYNL